MPAVPARRLRSTARPAPSAVRSQPSSRPHHRLNRGLAAQRAASAIAKRAAAEMHHVGLAVLRLHQVGVPGALQFDIRAMARSQDVCVRMQFVGSGQFARARHGDGVPPSRAALRGQQVVVAVALVEMRTFGEADARALENHVRRPHQLALRGEYSCSTIPRKRLCPGRWSHSMLTRYFRPSSSWNSEGSKPLLLR